MKISTVDNVVTVDGQGEHYYYLGNRSMFEFGPYNSEVEVRVVNFKFHYAQKGNFWTRVKSAYNFFKHLNVEHEGDN